MRATSHPRGAFTPAISSPTRRSRPCGGEAAPPRRIAFIRSRGRSPRHEGEYARQQSCAPSGGRVGERAFGGRSCPSHDRLAHLGSNGRRSPAGSPNVPSTIHRASGATRGNCSAPPRRAHTQDSHRVGDVVRPSLRSTTNSTAPSPHAISCGHHAPSRLRNDRHGFARLGSCLQTAAPSAYGLR